MKEVAISEFKAKCLALIDEVQKTKQSLRITRFGRPVVQVTIIPPETEERSWIGSMKHEMKILGDIVSPGSDESDWEALRD